MALDVVPDTAFDVVSLTYPVHPVGFYRNAQIYAKKTTNVPNITLIAGHRAMALVSYSV